jgi:protein associated with RNAse G/E
MNTDHRFKDWRQVQAYKHDGKLHRKWSPAFLVEETDEYWALASRMSAVVESDGRRWMTKEPAIFLLFKKKWMNVIAMFKESGGICYYVNIATPTIDDQGYLKYIDYDLDVKLYPDMVEKTLDEREFAHNAEHYGYSPELRKKIEKTKDEVLHLIDQRAFPFQNAEIERIFQAFLDRNRPQN